MRTPIWRENALEGAKIHEMSCLVCGLRIEFCEFYHSIAPTSSYLLTLIAASNSKAGHQKLKIMNFWTKIDVFEVLGEEAPLKGKRLGVCENP